MFLHLLFAFIASALISGVLTKLVRDRARAKSWLDRPDSVRHLHGSPVPRLGGVAIFATLIVMVTPSLWGRARNAEFATSLSQLWPLIAPTTLIFLTGLYDDFHPLKPRNKFAAELAAAGLLYFSGVGIFQFHLSTHQRGLGTLADFCLTLFWVLLVTNAFNLIDGLDGLAGGVALSSAVVLLVLSVFGGNAPVSMVVALLAGATIGFLRFNVPPATVFLGDSGSLLIGFLLSALALECPPKGSTMIALATPTVCFGLPILEVSISVVRRFLNNRPLFQGDNEHMHHMLLKRGICPRNAVLILYGITAGFGSLSLLLFWGGIPAALVLAVTGIALLVGIPQLRYPEFAELRRRGAFVLYRQLAERPVMLELNLLTGGFQATRTHIVRRLILDRQSRLPRCEGS